MNFENKDFAFVRNTSSFGHVTRLFPARGCRLPAAVPTRGGHFSRLEETRNLTEYSVSSFVLTFSLVRFYSYALFVTLFLHFLFVKLTKLKKEFQIRAKKDDSFSVYLICPVSVNGDREHLLCIIYFTYF